MVKRFFSNLFQNYGRVIVTEFWPFHPKRRLLKTLAAAFLIMILFYTLPIFAGSLEEGKVLLVGFLCGLAGIYIMRFIAWKLKNFLVNRKDVQAEIHAINNENE